MARYLVAHRYRSSSAVLAAGDTVELDDALAAWLLHDSPGVLTLVDGEAVVDESAPAPEPAPEAEADDVADEGATAPETDEAKPTRGGKR